MIGINDVNHYGYRGESHDSNELLYLRARYLNVENGMFTTEDTYLGEAKDPLSQNRYIYALNNPFKYSDPSGYRSVDSDFDIVAGSTSQTSTIRDNVSNSSSTINTTIHVLSNAQSYKHQYQSERVKGMTGSIAEDATTFNVHRDSDKEVRLISNDTNSSSDEYVSNNENGTVGVKTEKGILGTAIDTAISNPKEFGKGLLKGAVEYFKEIWQTVKEFVKKPLKVFLEILGSIKSMVSQLIKDAGNAIKSMVGGIIDTVKEVVKDALKLGKLVGKFVTEKVVEIAVGAVATVAIFKNASKISKAMDKISDVTKPMRKVVDAVSGAGSKVKTVVRGVNNSIENFIESNKVLKSVSNVVDIVKQPVKKYNNFKQRISNKISDKIISLDNKSFSKKSTTKVIEVIDDGGKTAKTVGVIDGTSKSETLLELNIQLFAADGGKVTKTVGVIEEGTQTIVKGANKAEISWPSKPHTNKTPGHWETIVDEANNMASSGDYSKIYVNKGLSNEIPGAKPNRRPDIMGVRNNGIIDQVEVPSKTDDPLKLIERMLDNKNIIGDRAGDIRIKRIK